jgi:predicted lipoprotein with Yx(FWY)xxD motif
MNALLKAASCLAAIAFSSVAQAHVVVTPTTAAPGSAETLNFIVGHGCNGQPTTALRVEMPKAVTAVEPQPKAGWTPTQEALPDGGRAVTWRGGEPLTKSDGFPVRVRLPREGAKVAFVAVQSCGETMVRWDESIPAEGPKPKHPAPTLTLAAAETSPAAPAPSTNAARLPKEVQRRADGAFADAAGKPLYVWDIDTMVGMSHCETDCAKMWPPLAAPKNAKPMGDWSPISREDGSLQWTYKTKPLYTYSGDTAGAPAAGEKVSNLWHLAH